MISRRSVMSGAAASLLSFGINPTTIASANANSVPTVFAWYQLQFGAYGNTVTGYQKEIQDAQSHGIDGFVLDMFGWNPRYTPWGNYQTWTSMIFEAALRLGTHFKLYFAVDWQANGEPAADAALMMAAWANHPNYYWYSGRPYLSGWCDNVNSSMGSADQMFWSAVISSVKAVGCNVFFAPCFGFAGFVAGNPGQTSANFVSEFNTSWLKDICQGLMGWDNLVPHLLTECNAAINSLSVNNKITFIPSVCSWFGIIRFLYKGKPTEFLEYNGYEGMSTLWQAAMRQNSPMIVIDTWNDYTESYMNPVTNNQLSLTCQPSTWQISSEYLTCHAGFTELTKYFIQWYKTGRQPAWTVDALFVAYRTASTKVHATNPTPGTKINWNPQRSGPTQDDLFITTICVSPATLYVYSGGVVTHVSVGAGLVHTRIPFSTGGQSFAILRNGDALVKITGANVVSTLGQYKNMNPVTYFAYGP